MRPSRFGNRDNLSVVERPALAALWSVDWTEDDLKRRRKAAPARSKSPANCAARPATAAPRVFPFLWNSSPVLLRSPCSSPVQFLAATPNRSTMCGLHICPPVQHRFSYLQVRDCSDSLVMLDRPSRLLETPSDLVLGDETLFHNLPLRRLRLRILNYSHHSLFFPALPRATPGAHSCFITHSFANSAGPPKPLRFLSLSRRFISHKKTSEKC